MTNLTFSMIEVWDRPILFWELYMVIYSLSNIFYTIDVIFFRNWCGHVDPVAEAVHTSFLFSELGDLFLGPGF